MQAIRYLDEAIKMYSIKKYITLLPESDVLVDKYLLSAHNGPGIVPGCGDREVTKTCPCLR